MSERFSKAHRISRSSEFNRIYQQGRLIKNEYFRLYVLPRGDAIPRLGLVVTKEVGKAATRNRLKRWIREWFRTHEDQLRGLDLVVQPKHPAADLDHEAFVENLRQLAAEFESESSLR